MNRKILPTISAVMIAVFAVCGCNLLPTDIRLVDAKTAVSIDENLMPVDVTDIFPKGTSKVSCWIKWKDAKINTQVVAGWHYVTDDIRILNYPFIIPKKEGMGSIVLTMPNGKNLPSGQYKVDLATGRRLLKSLKFTIE